MEQNTKEKILQTALGLFAKNGYAAVSVKELADALALSKGALYRHYASKRALFDCILARMEERDAAQAAAYALPEQAPEQDGHAYENKEIGQLVDYTMAQFRYWTEDPFAAAFRRLLTIEQYRDPEMAALYQQYLCSGPLGYIRALFCGMPDLASDAEALAFAFYAPVFTAYSLYDGAEDQKQPAVLLQRQLTHFMEKNSRKGANENGIHSEPAI